MFNQFELDAITEIFNDQLTDVSNNRNRNMKLTVLTSSDIANQKRRRWENWVCHELDGAKIYCDETNIALHVVVHVSSTSTLTRTELLRFLKTEYKYEPPVFNLSKFSYLVLKEFYESRHVSTQDIAAAIYVAATAVLANSYSRVKCVILLPCNVGTQIVIRHNATGEIKRVKSHCVTVVNDKAFDPVFGYYAFDWTEYLNLLHDYNKSNFQVCDDDSVLSTARALLKQGGDFIEQNKT